MNTSRDIDEEYVDLSPYTALQVTSIARFLVRIRTIQELNCLVASCIFEHYKHLILGGGSSVLFADTFFNGIVLKNEIMGIETEFGTERDVVLKVASGTSWEDVIAYSVENDYGGIENLTGIPGTAGAAVRNNISAYGMQISSLIDRIEAVDLDSGSKKVFSNAECGFGNRSSTLSTSQHRSLFIISIYLKLTKSPHHQCNTTDKALQKHLVPGDFSIRSISQAFRRLRQRATHSPDITWCAEAVFKDPLIKAARFDLLKLNHPALEALSMVDEMMMISAAWLVEQVFSNDSISEHAERQQRWVRVLAPHEIRTGDDILRLVRTIREDVWHHFGIHLGLKIDVITAENGSRASSKDCEAVVSEAAAIRI